MKNHLLLLAQFHPLFVKQELIPEILKNCAQFGLLSQTAYDAFQKHKFAENSFWFHHSYAETDIPAGQEYEAIAYSKNRKIQPDSIRKCHSRVLCFFTAFRTRPSDLAMQGHHELSLIWFEQESPPLLSHLSEITEAKPLDTPEQNYIYLGSETGLRQLIRKQRAVIAAAELLKTLGIRDEEHFHAQPSEKIQAIHEMIRKMTAEQAEQYAPDNDTIEEILYSALSELWRTAHRKETGKNLQ